MHSKETTITFFCVVKIHSQTIIENAMKLGVKVFSISHLSCAPLAQFPLRYAIFGLCLSFFQTAKNYGWASGGSSILSEFGTLHMEFAYLSDVTGDPSYKKAVEKVRDAIQSAARPRNLYPNYLNPKTGKCTFKYFVRICLPVSYLSVTGKTTFTKCCIFSTQLKGNASQK